MNNLNNCYTMNPATKEMFNDILSTAKILVRTPYDVNWDIAHYLADNFIGKIMMLKLVEEKGFNKEDVQKYKFPILVDKFQGYFLLIKLDYEEIKKQHSKVRNFYQHRLIVNYLTVVTS